jgi:hypothetical protein
MARIRFIHAATSAFAAVVLLATVATAAPTEADKETARSLMDQGDAQAESKHYTEALKLYQAAHDLMQVPTTGLEVARMQVALGQLLEARDTALAVTRLAVQPREPAVFAQSRVEAQQLADSLSGRIPALQIKVQGPAENVALAVQIDGMSVPQSAALLPRKVNPGKHTVVVESPGYQSARRDVEVGEGKVIDVVFTLERQATPVATPALAGTAPTSSTAPQPSTTAHPPAGSADVPAAPRRGLPALAYVGFGVGAAGIVTGSVAGIVTLSKKSSIQSDYCNGSNDCQPAAQDKIDSGRTWAMVSNIGFGVGIVGVGVGLAAWLAAPRHQEAPRAASRTLERTPVRGVALTPVVGVGHVGLLGSF